MTNRQETHQQYLAVCQLNKKPVNPFISSTLEAIDKEDEAKNAILDLHGNSQQAGAKKEHQLNDEDALALYNTLRINLCIRSLDLRYNKIGDEGAKHLASMLRENEHLVWLNLMCNDIGGAGARALSEALQKNKSVVYFNLNGNKIGNEGGMSVAEMLQVNFTIRQLDLGHTDMKMESLIAIATILHTNKTLQMLNINRPVPEYQYANWMDEIAQHYASMLKVNSALRELHMQKFQIRDYGALWFSEKLLSNLNLVHLDLSSNRITRDGAKLLAEYLKKDTPLKALDLGYNRLENDGACWLAEALMYSNTHLERLSVKQNNIGDAGLFALADACDYNTTLTHLYMWGNEFDQESCWAFKKLIDKSRLKLDHLDVSPYIVDGKCYMSELSNGINVFYYWQPLYGSGASYLKDQKQHQIHMSVGGHRA